MQCLKHCCAGLENVKPGSAAEVAEGTTDQQLISDCFKTLQLLLKRIKNICAGYQLYAMQAKHMKK